MRKFMPVVLLVVLVLALSACATAEQEPVNAVTEAPPADPVEEPGFSCNPTAAASTSYDAPEQVITEGNDYVATITMENGAVFVIDLYPEAAPITVNNFVFLACEGFYDGVTFHRVIPGFVAQGGDPTGTGGGGPGYTIEHEADNGIPFDRPALVSMAHRGIPRTTGSQFFITYRPTPELDADFTVFGEVIEGYDDVVNLTPRDPQVNPSAPPGDVIATIRVEEVAGQ